MKSVKSTILKTTIYSLAFLSMCTLVSCSQSDDSADTKEIAEEQNDEKFAKSKQDDAENLVAAAEIDLEEIKLGQLAQTKSSNADVKALGKMMEEHHTQALEELKALAKKKEISIPTSITKDGQDAYDKLNEKSGSEFDTKYCDMMVDGHEKAIKKIENTYDETEDSDIKSWSNALLNSLRQHLKHAEECKEKCDQKKSKS